MTVSSVVEPPRLDDLVHYSRWRRGAVPVFIILGVDIFTVLLFGIISPSHVFLSLQSFKDLALNGCQTALLGVGVAFLLGAGELDISLGANIILSSVVGGKVMVAMAGTNSGAAIALGVIACIATGAAGGFFNSVVVTRLRVNSFIATLAMLGIMTGLADVLTGGYDIAGIPLALQRDFGVANLFESNTRSLRCRACYRGRGGVLAAETRFGLRTLALGSFARGGGARRTSRAQESDPSLHAGGVMRRVWRPYRSQSVHNNQSQWSHNGRAGGDRWRGHRRHELVWREDLRLGRRTGGHAGRHPSAGPGRGGVAVLLPAHRRRSRPDRGGVGAGIH